jgi:riboflavin kinase/FMN adenylyltransferase
MRVIRSLEDIQHDPNSVVTVGSFDGVHLAHREILKEVVHRSKMREGRSVVVTFEPHPSEVVRRGRQPVPLLTTLEERLSLLETFGIDLVCVLNFDAEFAKLTPEEFYRRYIIDLIGLSEVVVGYDHMFGRDREAGVHDLLRMGQRFNFSVFTAQAYTVDGVTVGSTEIRRLLLNGDVERASRLLGYPYRLKGTVVRGDGRGRELGYPTANIVPESPRKLVPGRGVYLVAVDLEETRWFGMMNIGRRPTISNQTDDTLEVNIFSLNRELYGVGIAVTFLRRLRDERRFGSEKELMLQLHKDREVSMQYLSELGKRT